MPLGTDPTYLLQSQYRNSANLNARMALHARFSLNPYGWHRWVFDQFELPPESRILELGCGPGTLWLQNQKRISPGWEITLSDFSAGMIEDARRNLGEIEHPFRFQVFDAQSIPLPDASLDAVIANHMLYHVPDRSKAFAEIRRILKPEGRLYAATNGYEHLQELEQLQKRFGISDALVTHALGFRLENGREQLAPWFDSLHLRLYEDGLLVTEVEPLVAYILSESGTTPLSEEQQSALRAFLASELAQRGAIRITKSTGLFFASVAAAG